MDSNTTQPSKNSELNFGHPSSNYGAHLQIESTEDKSEKSSPIENVGKVPFH